MAHPGQLQEWQGYQRIGLDVRIPKIPIFPVFRIRFGRKSGKTVFPFHSFVAYTGQLQKRQGYPRIGLDLRIPTVPIFPVFRIRFGRKSGKTEKKTFFPFCIFVAQPEQLQEWQGYQRIRLDLRIPKIQSSYKNGRGIHGSGLT